MNNVCSAARQLEPLSAPQATFEDDYDGATWTFSNCSLLHKLLITGQGEQVVSRRGELDRDLLSTTCEMESFSKVRCRIGVKCSLVITILRNRNRTKSRELAMFNF